MNYGFVPGAVTEEGKKRGGGGGEKEREKKERILRHIRRRANLMLIAFRRPSKAQTKRASYHLLFYCGRR